VPAPALVVNDRPSIALSGAGDLLDSMCGTAQIADKRPFSRVLGILTKLVLIATAIG
jgi:hypothetical protein